MIRRPPRSTRTDTLFPYTTLFRSVTGFFSDHFGRRGLEPMREAFAHLAANRGAYDNLQSLAEMAIIYSRYSQDNIDGIGSEVAYIDYFRGAHNALLDQRIPFDVLSDQRVTTRSEGRSVGREGVSECRYRG